MHKKVCIKYVHLTSFKIIEEIKKILNIWMNNTKAIHFLKNDIRYWISKEILCY